MKIKISWAIYIILFSSTIFFLYQALFFRNKLDEVKIHLKEAKQELQKMNVLLSKSRQQIEMAMIQMKTNKQEAGNIKTAVESASQKYMASKNETQYLLDSLKSNVLKEFESIEAIKTELNKFE